MIASMWLRLAMGGLWLRRSRRRMESLGWRFASARENIFEADMLLLLFVEFLVLVICEKV